MNFASFIDTYRDALAQAVVEAYPPLYTAEARQSCGFDLRRLLRRPLGAQADAIRATALALQTYSSASIVGEMGTGKSYAGAAAAYLAGCRRVLVMSPPHLVKKWQREILQTVPGAHVAIVRTIGDLERVRRQGVLIQFVVCSREGAKLGYRWMPATIQRMARDETGSVARDDAGEIVRLLCCPTCFGAIADDEGVPLTWDELATKKHRCSVCGNPLWQADPTGPRRYPLADYIARRMTGYFDLLVVDEAHEMKARGSAQGLAAGALADACPRTLTLTGTVFGGCARRH
ncbi:MAG: DEAD/DEAH box helicase family protein [Anaerolineae bacterium]